MAAETRPAAEKPAPEKAAPEKIAFENPVSEKAMPEKAVAEAPAKEAAPAARPADNRSGIVTAELRRQGENLKLTFAFPGPVPAAMFRRADALWLVFDTPAKIDVTALGNDATRTIRTATATTMDNAQVVRIQLERPRLMSVATDADTWFVTVGDTVVDPSRALAISRNMLGATRSSLTIPFNEPRLVHRLIDPDIGDTLLVVSALGPARGFLKTQDFVELRALASSHGVVVQPLADDLAVDLAADKVSIARPGGLTLSGTAAASRNSTAYRPIVFDSQLWGFDRQANFNDRQFKLLNAASDATENRRAGPRLDLARFYLARELYTEAKAVLDVTLADDRATADDPTALVLHAITNIMLGRPEQALKDLASPMIGNQHDAPLWRALAYAKQGRWPEAREGFKSIETAIGALPAELQRLALKEAMRSSIEVRDFGGATTMLNELETVGIPRDMEAELSVLVGRLSQGMGRTQDALNAYRVAADSPNRPIAAQGRLRETVLRYELGDLKPNEVINELETLTALWRGDETEIEALQLLARLYTQAERYRDAFYIMRTALRAHPNSEMTRKIQDEAAATFDTLFLAGKGDALPAIDALSLFYDFRELTPIGRRGDEMIRRLADRLVSVDLLTQAAELLQHQVDNRLQGAARAQVATRLAVIYLMNRKPEKAQATLKATRMSELSNDMRNLRLMLEARALSDIGRHDVALEIIADMDRREAIRLRADILWVARRFRESAEQIELLNGERWRDFEPLKENERADILRAAIGFALSEDTIGIGRLREKYVAKMAESADRRAFEIATSPIGASPAEFREIARAVAGLDTLESFLRDLRVRHPEIGALSPVAPTTPPAAPPAAPKPQAAAEGAPKVTTKPVEPPPTKQAAAAH
jgi:tetratricopeptide (TPR) repeat protein